MFSYGFKSTSLAICKNCKTSFLDKECWYLVQYRWYYCLAYSLSWRNWVNRLKYNLKVGVRSRQRGWKYWSARWRKNWCTLQFSDHKFSSTSLQPSLLSFTSMTSKTNSSPLYLGLSSSCLSYLVFQYFHLSI